MKKNDGCKGCFGDKHCYLQVAVANNDCPCKTCLVKGICRPMDTCDARKLFKIKPMQNVKPVDVNNVYRDIE